MNVTLTNRSPVTTPIASDQAGGFAEVLQPGQPLAIGDAEITELTIGDNPGFVERFKNDLADLVDRLEAWLTFWRDQAPRAEGSELGQVGVEVVNHGPNGLRIVLGEDNSDDLVIGAGQSQLVSAPGYVTLRELGVGAEVVEPHGGA
jgi:hypothetical protein